MAEQNNSSFFERLTKLFSTQAIVKVDKDGKRKVVDTDDRQRGGTNLMNLTYGLGHEIWLSMVISFYYKKFSQVLVL